MSETGNIPLGILLTLLGAMLLALGMVLQRYGLSYPINEVPMPCGKTLSRNRVWICGFLTYFAGNGLYAVALPLAPLSLLAGIFTTLLIFNLIFANRLMKEPLTKYKLMGAGVIIAGVCLCVASTPSGVPTTFTSDQITGYLRSARGVAYYVVLVLLILSTASSIHWFEKTYYADEDLAKEENLVLDLFDDMVEEPADAGAPETQEKEKRLPRFLRSFTRAYEVHDRIQVMSRKPKVLEAHSGFSLLDMARAVTDGAPRKESLVMLPRDAQLSESRTAPGRINSERLSAIDTRRDMDVESPKGPSPRTSIKSPLNSAHRKSLRMSPRNMGRRSMNFSRTRTMVDILTDHKKNQGACKNTVIMDAVTQLISQKNRRSTGGNRRGTFGGSNKLSIPKLPEVPEEQESISNSNPDGRQAVEEAPSSTRKRKKKLDDLSTVAMTLSDEENEDTGKKQPSGNESADELSENEVQETPTPTVWQLNLMGIIYPGSLGVDEGLGLLAMKGVVAVLAAGNWWASGVFWFMLLTWLTCALGTLWWLRVVFARYETTKALPIEYGMVNVMQVLSGLIFFREDRYYAGWQFALLFSGVFVILCGIQVGRWEEPHLDEDLMSPMVEYEHEVQLGAPGRNMMISVEDADAERAKPGSGAVDEDVKEE